MNNLANFIEDLSQQNVQLWVEGDKLRYRAPKEALTSTILNQIKQHKTEIIDLLGEDSYNSKTIPLSYGQQGLWFLYKLAPHSAAYNIAFTVRIRSHLNIPALQRAVQKLVTRHRALRTTFSQRDGEPFQEVHQYQEVCIETIDASNWDDSELRNKAIAAYKRPFDLERGSVIRVNLFTCSPQEYVLILTIHHIIGDGFSSGIIINELRLLYEAENTGYDVSLAPVNYSYKDFVQWQNKMLKSSEGDNLWAYWQKQFAGELPVLNMPTDRPRLPVQNHQGACYNFEITKELADNLRAIGRSQGATLYMTMLAAFQVLLHRYTGQEDIVVGSPTEGRSKAEFANTVGFFVNMLALRVNLAGLPTFVQVLSQVRQTVLAALTHQDYPSTLLIEQLRLNRDPSLLGLFRASFNLLNLEEMVPEYELSVSDKTRAIEDWGGLKLEPFVIPQQEGQNDLVLDIVETRESLIGIFRYNTDLFDQTTIERMVGNLQALLEGIVSNPQQKIALLPMLSEVEHNLLRNWNHNQVEYAQDLCIHQLFEDRVNKTPNAIAVSFKDEQLTYQELNFRANQLARYLQGLGVKPEVLVGICVERSLDMVVGLLGILKAGGAYVPLDGRLPQERLNFMLADSQVSVLLTQQKLLEILPQQNVPVVCLDKDWEVISQESQTNLVNTATPENLAYIIYTSGSTGRSKGVAIAHRSLVNAYWSWEDAYQLHSLSSHLQMASFSFDVFSGDLIRAVCSGGKLVLCPRELLLEPQKLYELMREEKIDAAEFVPAVLRYLVEYLEKSNQNLHFMRLLMVGSDSLYVKEFQEWKRFCGINTRLINSYGLTEVTIDSTYFENTNVNLSVDGLVPIGRPFNNTQVYILDTHLQQVPIGVPGELHIGGVSLARGYLNRPELTKQKFIPNPFIPNPVEGGLKEELLYKTGDLARYLPDGNISFIGRIDNQVKIRGFRIELGEIEAVLKCHPQIQEAVVITGEHVGTKCLVAYVVLDESLTIQKVREFIKQKLPDYMIPSAFVTLDTLPLSPNGKIDRKALPAPNWEITQENEYVAPRTQTEEIIAKIFAQVLNVENIGIHDNFFELGGHSLLATQLISRVREAFSIEIPLRELFSFPTVAQLDHRLTQLRNTKTLPPIQPRSHHQELPLSWAQERVWFLNQLEGKSATYNIPVAFRISGNLDINALQKALSEIVRRHEVLRTSFQTVNGTPIQVIDPEATFNINLVDLQQLETTKPEDLVLEQAQQEATTPFDLENAPLIRCSLLQLSTSEYVFLLTMHHIISDGWSMGIFIQELSSLYQAFIRGEDISSPDATRTPLASLPIQYADFAVWQRQYLTGEVLSTQLDYWKHQLSDAPDLLQLPTDFPRPTVQTYQGCTRRFSLNTDLTTNLQTLSRNSGTTLFMTLYAAFSTLLYRYSGQSDILIGSPIANRNRSEIEGLIGFFLNTLVLRTRFEDNPSFKELLAQVRETTLKAYEHQDVPFEELIEALQVQRSLSHSTLFQVMFILQNTPSNDIELPGTTLSPIELQSTIAKFDLTLSITETEQGLVGEWEYSTDLFDGETIERMVAHFQNLLEAIVENPSHLVGNLNLLSPWERHQLLVEWNHTATDYSKDKCIHQLFEQQVEKTPDAIAVVFEEEQLTYQQLNQRANQLANHLQSIGVKPEVLVGICVERSVEMVVALLGILKAGGAYVPLDPNYPPERLNYMLRDSDVGVLVTQSSLLESLPEHNARVVCLDRDRGAIEQNSRDNLDVGVGEDNLAYIIYTSGSTGKPKGVMITHKALGSFTQTAISEYKITASDNVLQFASINFDAAVEEIYPCLSTGATLVLRTHEMLADLQTFFQTCTDLHLTVLDLPTAYWHQLVTDLESTEVTIPESLRLVIIGGEKVLSESVRYWQEYVTKSRKSDCLQLINTYGPTETTVTATVYPIQSSICSGKNEVPIGRPITNTQIYILDSHLQPVPVGVTGELYIGGDGLARGYLNRPQLTSEKFILNPFDKLQRLYKTGDLARYLPDGNITFMGRIDNQVKIRGFRIELGEIEAVLATHPQVNQTVVIAQEENTGNKRLVAYAVSDESLTTHQIREFLRQKLPDYMVPSAFVTLDTLPLTPNGKVDRKALPEPSRVKPEDEYVAPRTPIEFQLTQIWSSVLNITSVGVQDNFFELGGHSLLAVRLMSQIQQQFQKNLPLATLFQSSTIEQLALLLSSDSSEQLSQTLVPIQQNGSLSPLFCVGGTGGNVINFYHLAQYLGKNQPFYGLQPQGFDGETQPLGSIEEIASQYIKAIQTVQPVGPYFLVGYSFGGYVIFEMATQLQRMGESVAYVGILDIPAPIEEFKNRDDFSNWDNAQWICQIAASLEEIIREKLLLSYETLASMSELQQINYFKEKLELVGFLPPQTDIKFVRGLLQVFQTQMQIEYLPKNTSTTKITLFQTQESKDKSENLYHISQNTTWSWNQFSDEEVEIHLVPGSHYSMMNEPHVKVLAEKLQKSLEQAQDINTKKSNTKNK